MKLLVNIALRNPLSFISVMVFRPKLLQRLLISNKISSWLPSWLLAKAQSWISLKTSKLALIHGFCGLKIADFWHSLSILQTNATTYLNLSEKNPSTRSFFKSISLAKIGLLLATVSPPKNYPKVIRYYLIKLP